MRLATITNWAYAATVVLTIASSATMLLASNATDRERAAVEQRYRLDQATATLEEDVFLLSDRARQYVNTGDPTYLVGYRSEEAALKSVEERISHIGDAGASTGEIEALADAVRLADLLHDEQRAAVAAHEGGDEAKARQLLFGAEYERQLDRAELEIKRFRDRLDARVQSQVNSATEVARLWKGISEITLALTALLVLCVLYFVFKQRVLRPVVKLSDVVNRLAAQDFAAEPPAFDQVDEIGDMAQAIRIFRENGLERQRLESERDADRAMRDLLSRMTQRLQGCDTMDDLKDVVQRFVPEITPGLAGRLYLLDRQRNMVVEACGWQNPGHSRAEFSALACLPCDHVDRSDAAAPIDTLCLPLTAQRETLGLLYFEAPAGNPGALSGPEIYLDMLAENIGLAIANLQLRETLREMALADPLTGLSNRRQLDQLLGIQIAQAERLGQDLGCLMIDVDHFKRFNDVHGHDAGDMVLREVGKVLAGVTRDAGLAFRYGGEEFMLLLPGLSVEAAAERAEEIRTRVAALALGSEAGNMGPVTVSIGVAITPLHCPPDRLVRTADAALLRAKAMGRDRCASAFRAPSCHSRDSRWW